MCTKKKHIPRKRYWQIVKTGGRGVTSKKQIKKQKPQQFFNSVCKHFIKIEILTLQAVFPDKLFK